MDPPCLNSEQPPSHLTSNLKLQTHISLQCISKLCSSESLLSWPLRSQQLPQNLTAADPSTVDRSDPHISTADKITARVVNPFTYILRVAILTVSAVMATAVRTSELNSIFLKLVVNLVL